MLRKLDEIISNALLVQLEDVNILSRQHIWVMFIFSLRTLCSSTDTSSKWIGDRSSRRSKCMCGDGGFGYFMSSWHIETVFRPFRLLFPKFVAENVDFVDSNDSEIGIFSTSIKFIAQTLKQLKWELEWACHRDCLNSVHPLFVFFCVYEELDGRRLGWRFYSGGLGLALGIPGGSILTIDVLLALLLVSVRMNLLNLTRTDCYCLLFCHRQITFIT